MKIKKVLSMLVAFIMLFGMTAGMLPVSAASPEGDFSFDAATGTITGYTGAGGAVEIPGIIGGVIVTAIGDNAFLQQELITSVTIPGSVKSIGEMAFNFCRNIESVDIKDGVESIGDYAFCWCENLTSINIPNSVTSIGTGAISICSNLESIDLPDNITFIDGLFNQCPKLKEIVIPDKVTRIGGCTFYNCSALTTVTLPASLEKVEGSAFYNCTSLTSLIFPSGLYELNNEAFIGCSALTEVYFTGNAPYFDYYDESLYTSLGSSCKFYYKDGATGFTDIFHGVATVPLYNINIEAVSGGSIKVVSVTGGKNLDLKSVETDATVNLEITPDSGKILSNGSLKYTGAIVHQITGTSFTMPAESISVSAEFMNTPSAYYDITFGTLDGGSITADKSDAASGEFVYLTITPSPGNQLKPGTLKYTLNGNTYDISGTSFKMPEGNVCITAEFEPTAFVFDSATGTITGYIGTGGAVVIPSLINQVPVFAIGENAFKDQNTILSIDVPSTVTSIGAFAFSYCGSLVTAKLPDTLASMGVGLFSNSINLTDVNIPKGITTIPNNTFTNCSDLKSISIPGNIKRIGFEAFYGCYSLERLMLSEGLEAIDESAFKACLSMKGVVIPSSVLYIEKDAFSGEIDDSMELTAAVFKGASPLPMEDTFRYASDDFTIFYPESEKDSYLGYYYHNSASYDPTGAFKLKYDSSGANSGSVPAESAGLSAGTYSIVDVTDDLSKSGYRFDKWNTRTDGSGRDYYENDIIFVGGADITLYAQWVKLYKIDIANVLHGSISTNVTEADPDAAVEVVTTPEEGWRLKPGTLKYTDGTSEVLIDTSMLASVASAIKVFHFNLPAKDITITAEFESNSSDYTFDETNGTILKYHGTGGNIVIPSTINGFEVKYIGEYAFSNAASGSVENTTITSVVVPEGVIGIDDGAFSDCTALLGVTLPESLEYLGHDEFLHCKNLKSVRIPANLKEIGNNAFNGCESLLSAHFEGNAPTVYLGDAIFDNTASSFRILYHSGSTGFDTAPLSNYPSFETESANPATAVTADLDELDVIYAFSDTSSSVENNLYLTVTGAVYGSDITWKTSNAEVITADGSVTVPSDSSKDTIVKLTATASCNGTEASKEFELTVPGAGQTEFTVTFNSNGGSTEVKPASMTVIYGEALGILPAAPTRSGYSFTGWNTAANGSGTAFTAATPVTANITVYAQWTAVTSSYNSNYTSNSDGSSGTPTTTTTTNTTPTVTSTITTTATTGANGNTTAVVTASQVTDAVNQAAAAAAQAGAGTAANVEIKVTAPAGATAVTTSIPEAAMNTVASSTAGLMVSTPIAAIAFDENALNTIAGAAAGNVNITASTVEAATLSAEIQQVVGDRPIYNFSVTSGDKTISQFGGNVKVAVPYTPQPGEDTSAIVIYYINAEGKSEMVSNCAYDTATGTIKFTTTHFSTYAVGYNKVTFKDVTADAAYSKAVCFIAARGITTGIGNGNFSPEAAITRGQFIVMVMKAYGIKPDETSKDNFADAGSTYYTNYLSAAKRLGLTSGTGNNKYSPDKEITQQEMISLLYKTLKVIGELPTGTKGKDLTTYTDTNQIASWAKDAMALFVKTGIISGSGGKLAPVSTTTRAEVAQVLYGLLSK